MDHISEQQMSAVIRRALEKQWMDKADTAVIFHDLSFLQHRIAQLRRAFPKNTLHAVAVKANPLPRLLHYMRSFDVGAEAATFPELYIAQHTDYDATQIVFDSPAKTEQEIRYALEHNIHINADSFEEVERIAQLRSSIPSKSTVGVRINPQVGMGKISITSVSGAYSKFGIPFNDSKEALMQTYRSYPWLNGIHVHIGSQGCSVEQLVKGTQRVYQFAEKVNNESNKAQITMFDIGGGLPVSYYREETPVSIEEYADALRAYCPRLFDGPYRLITEFGRYVHANCGWTAARVEYVKTNNGKNTAMVHVGADLLMRRCYLPDQWHHELSVLDRNGNIKSDQKSAKYTIAGPLCFNGDIIARDVDLPLLEEGDFLLVHDTGAYTLSMWNRHTSRQIPKVLGYEEAGKTFTLLKQRETPEDVRRFWM